MITQCPHCLRQYEVDNQFDGQIVECQDCRQEFVIEKFENNIVLRKIQKAHPPEKRKIKWYQKIFIGLGIFIFWLGIVFIISAKTDIGFRQPECMKGAACLAIGLFIAVAPFCKSR